MSGRTVLITGACGDIGRSLSRAFAEQGDRLALCDLHPAIDAKSILQELEAAGAGLYYESVDVTDAAAMEKYVAAVTRTLGVPAICIANAGIVERGSLVDLSVDAWRRTLDVNLTGAFITAQAAVRAMLAAKCHGHVVFVSSWAQDVPRENIGAYCASKGGLKMLAKTLALELAPKGIRANLVAPGWVDAGLTGQNLHAAPERRAAIEAQIPLGRLASADEVARTVRLLCSSDAGYVTGTTLLVDGGSSLGFRR